MNQPQRRLALAALLLPLLAIPAVAADCAQLTRLASDRVAITVAEPIDSGSFTPPNGKPLDGLPHFCRIAATLHPSPDSAIRIELWLPESNWNGRLEGTGNGGFAGSLSYGSLADGLRHGYAVVNTDMGMQTKPAEDAMAFVDRPERWKDWGYRATHEMTVEAKRFIAAFYNRPAAHAYFAGCSTGGQQAWMEAQRYPDDYEGIVGGAPANNRTGVHESILFNFIATERAPQHHLPPAKLHLLAKAVMTACDALDGVSDGIIDDPRQCAFDPSTLACSGPNGGLDNDTCLTSAQVATVHRLYTGPVNQRTGQSVYPGMPKGSELGWDHLGPTANGQPPFAPLFAWVFGRQWDWRTFDFDRGVTAVDNKLAPILNATATNLDTFNAHGHKLLIYHGWADWLVVPGESIRDREAFAAHYAGKKNLDDFYRLFMVPGMTHCSGGAGPDRFDALSAMVDWVENGRAPDQLIASQSPAAIAAGAPPRSRPLCPYPQAARYKGTGDPNDAANFACTAPHEKPR